MRARFSAYVKGEIDYILASTHPDNPAAGGSRRDGEVVSTLRQDAQATHSKAGTATANLTCTLILHTLCRVHPLPRTGATLTGATPCSCGVLRQVRWLRLKVLGRDSGPGGHEDEAFVAFQAWFKFKDQQQQRQRGTRTESLRERRCASAACLVAILALFQPLALICCSGLLHRHLLNDVSIFLQSVSAGRRQRSLAICRWRDRLEST